MSPTAVTVTALILIALVPLSLGAAGFLWKLHNDVRAADGREHQPFIRLSFVLAIVGTIAALAGTYIGVLAAVFLLGFRQLAAALYGSPLYFIALVALDAVPVLIAGYLRWARGQEDLP